MKKEEISSPEKNKHKHPLAVRLLVYILMCSSLVTLFATLIQLYVDFQKDVEQIEDRLQQIGSSYLESLTLSAWNMDTPQINSMLTGIQNLPDIEHAAVYLKNEDKIYQISDRPTLDRIITRNYDLEILEEGSKDINVNIGELKVIASLRGAIQRLQDRVLVILSGQMIKTFIVSAFIIFIIRSLVTRHLNKMGVFAEELDLTSLETQLTLNRKKKANSEPDELDRVVTAFNKMIGNLKKSAKEMEVQARLEGELNAAAVVQRSFSPEKLPDLKGFEISSLFHPAREMSGDYYDFIQINERYIALVVADVSGKGVSAALYANIARVLLREKSEIHHDPISLLCSLNQSLQKEFHSNHFLTMSLLILDQQESKITYSSAGHEPIVLIKARENGYSLLKPKGYPFSELHASMFDQRVQEESYNMQSGDVIFCYTDGLTDIENEEGEMFSEVRLYESVQKRHRLTAYQIQDEIIKELRAFQGSAEQTDDITMIVLKRV